MTNPTPPLIVFDGVCVLCSGFVQWVIRHDAAGVFRFTAAQGAKGSALYEAAGLDPDALETILLVVDGATFTKFAAVIETAVRLGGVWRAATVLRVLPKAWGDALYDLVARRRYALFGRRETCWLPRSDRVI